MCGPFADSPRGRDPQVNIVHLAITVITVFITVFGMFSCVATHSSLAIEPSKNLTDLPRFTI